MDSRKSVRSNRRVGQIVYWLGLMGVIVGAAIVLWASVLPWLTLKVFNLPLLLPGVVGLGAATGSVALLALARSRSFPILHLVFGLICMGVGVYAQQNLGRTAARYILDVNRCLMPVNARLEQASLPPIEPFGAGVISRDYLGPGPGWTIWGGALLALGGAVQFAGGRLERTCAHCGTCWRRGRELNFCYRCGTAANNDPRCARCFAPLEKGDRFCIHCGLAA